MARASIPNVMRGLVLRPDSNAALPPSERGAAIAFAAGLTACAVGCGSAVFYEDDPSDVAGSPDESADVWVEAPVLAPGPSWDDGLSCEDSVAIARVRVLGGLDTAKALGDRDRQRCLGEKAALLSTLHAMIAEGDENEGACRAAREVFTDAEGCGG